VISARTANVFGESQPVTKFVPTVIRNLLAGDPVRLFGDARRRWIHADDVADTLIGITGDVNVTGADLLDNRQIVERIAARLGIVPKIEIVAAGRPGHEGVYDLVPSPGMTDDLDAGLDRVVAWFAR
jgi:dTDP-D-glucose 4,6-dehydratase